MRYYLAPHHAPPRWWEFRAQQKPVWLAPFLYAQWCGLWVAHGLGNWSFVEVLEYLSAFSVLVAVVLYFAEGPERTKSRHYQAWQVINTAQGKGGSGGRSDALRELNADGVPLVGVDVSGAFLQGVELKNADLRRADLHAADLRDAKLDGAKLELADLRSTNLRGASLHDADLRQADLRDADLTGATLDGADVTGATFDGADLHDVHGAPPALRAAPATPPAR